jgi:hypothetical protein
MRREGTTSWPTPEAIADVNAVLPHLGIASQGVHHGTHGIHNIGRYCACCDAFRPGVYACGTCGAPWERAS